MKKKALKIALIIITILAICFVINNEIKYNTDDSANNLEDVCNIHFVFDYNLNDESIIFNNKSNYLKSFSITFEPKYYNSFIGSLKNRNDNVFTQIDSKTFFSKYSSIIDEIEFGKSLNKSRDYICYSSLSSISVKHYFQITNTPIFTEIIIDKTDEKVNVYIFVFTSEYYRHL